MDLRNSIHWDRQLEEGLPDCRLSGHRRKVTMWARMPMEQVFCVNCGKSGGLVTAEWCPHVFYLCDECYYKHGGMPGPQVSEDLVRGK